MSKGSAGGRAPEVSIQAGLGTLGTMSAVCLDSIGVLDKWCTPFSFQFILNREYRREVNPPTHREHFVSCEHRTGWVEASKHGNWYAQGEAKRQTGTHPRPPSSFHQHRIGRQHVDKTGKPIIPDTLETVDAAVFVKDSPSISFTIEDLTRSTFRVLPVDAPCHLGVSQTPRQPLLERGGYCNKFKPNKMSDSVDLNHLNHTYVVISRRKNILFQVVVGAIE